MKCIMTIAFVTGYIGPSQKDPTSNLLTWPIIPNISKNVDSYFITNSKEAEAGATGHFTKVILIEDIPVINSYN